MNLAFLNELQKQRSYPSITLLFNTSPGAGLSSTETATALALMKDADRRLDGDVDDSTRKEMMTELALLLEGQTSQPSGHAIALCVSPDFSAAVQLGKPVEERVIIDETFATRDLVADHNRTATYRVVTVSEQRTRLFVGDRTRVVEERNDRWPLVREQEQNTATWDRLVTQQLKEEHALFPLPAIVGGVQRSVRQLVRSNVFDAIGFIPGNHDRTTWSDLHRAAWPLVSDWLRTESNRAIDRLEDARSSSLYAGGIDEVWSLANDGRVSLLVVEEGFALAARIMDDGQLDRAVNAEDPAVIDDVVDEVIEAVLLKGGQVVIVPNDHLHMHQHIAAILRY
jgi:Bacterial archaeo-eukaryotic release factor family 3